MIERIPGGDELHYKNILANSEFSRFITSTKENATATRTRDGYTIESDIDQHVADKWSKKIGKPVFTPLDSILQQMENTPTPYMTYPQGLTEGVHKNTNKRSRENETFEPYKKNKSA